jgi:galactose mutarotase-like enzyme
MPGRISLAFVMTPSLITPHRSGPPLSNAAAASFSYSKAARPTTSRTRRSWRAGCIRCGGYPFAPDAEADYALTDSGLAATTTTNIGDSRCPYGSGQHPYLSPGTGLIGECTLTIAAATHIATDNASQLRAGTEPPGGTPFDFQYGRKPGTRRIDAAFTGLERVPVTGASGGA